jgi:hypothetical protein
LTLGYETEYFSNNCLKHRSLIAYNLGVNMPNYQAPQRDIQFVMHEVLAMADHYKSVPGGEDMDAPMIDAILEEASKFSENVLAPINASGDAQGCQWNNGVVTTPAGFKELMHNS